MEDKAQKAFMNGSVLRAVLKNAIPSICAMLMVLIYNLADFFFIGQTHNDYMVAAVSLATPVFLIYMALGSLFGIGGTSVISRALGENKKDFAKKVNSFCTWGCVFVGVILTVLSLLFMDKIVIMLGASSETFEYTKIYLCIVSLCGTFSMLSNCFSNTIRAEGESTVAMNGTVIGNVVNVVLDPVFIFGFNMGIQGAAIATFIGTITGCIYYFIYFAGGKSLLSISLRDFSTAKNIICPVLAIGIPAAMINILMSISNIIANAQMAMFGDLNIAAYGVSSKLMMIIATVAFGFSQGVLPLFGYCYGAKEFKRLFASIRLSLLLSTCLSVSATILCLFYIEPVVKLFLTDKNALESGMVFTQIMFVSGWTIGIMNIFMSTLQALGDSVSSLVISLCRQGFVFIPAVFIMKIFYGMYGIVWAQPVADFVTVILAFLLFLIQIKRTEKLQQIPQ